MQTLTAPAWTPCRRHLMDLVLAIPAQLRPRAHWRMTSDIWAMITADPELKSNWWVRQPTSRDPYANWLLDMPVHLNGVGTAIDLIIPVNCRPPER